MKIRAAFLLLIVSAAIIVTFLHQPVTQDPHYHLFADRRTFFGIANFWNVVTNLPFLLTGLAGLQTIRSGKARGGLHSLHTAYVVFFSAIVCVALGSSIYHWVPTNGTLVWDRLPMAVAFMAFFAAILGEYIDSEIGRRLLMPLLLVGALSVISWQLGESYGEGDLRLYALVQFLPMLVIPLVLVLYPTRLHPGYYMWSVLVAYGLSKLAEHWDGVIFIQSHGVISGHSVKHLLAGLGTYLYLLALRRRCPAASVQTAATGYPAG